ncbi:hypothetical protein [Candidatus Thioglobus sp. NP1]|uniref:hypothetical protein n=1 Tax=Candidatus Thioglobus sp. NP1 TaxID=2508687 RepID=UPI000DED5F2C|nr:hypothetical protein [Candidatus Thioglobus sp. NP1]AXE61924.1 hypothetical protein CRN91_04485 [Candidatus Thioglobus sp. NP1]
MRKLHLMNKENRDATVAISSLKYEKPFEMGIPNKELNFKRYLSATQENLHKNLASLYGDNYSSKLIEEDPEIDIEAIGKFISGSDVVYLSSKGELLYSPPKTVEVIIAPDGTEKERRSPEDIPGNVDDELPVRWTGKKMPKSKVAVKFAFKRTIQIKHVDGLTFDYLFDMAKELQDEDVMVLVGAGQKGNEPLIFQANGMPYRGFLEGRVDGKKYQLLLHLSNMELKRISSEPKK